MQPSIVEDGHCAMDAETGNSDGWFDLNSSDSESGESEGVSTLYPCGITNAPTNSAQEQLTTKTTIESWDSLMSVLMQANLPNGIDHDVEAFLQHLEGFLCFDGLNNTYSTGILQSLGYRQLLPVLIH